MSYQERDLHMTIIYILMFLIGGVTTSLTGLFDNGNSISLNSPQQMIGLIAFLIAIIGLYGFILRIWFKILRLFYPKASKKRLRSITGSIILILLIILCCFTGIGAVTLFFIKRPLTNLASKDGDR